MKLPDGMSMEYIGTFFIYFKVAKISSKGVLIGGLKENPKIASTIN